MMYERRTEDIIKKVEDLLLTDRPVRISGIAKEIGISETRSLKNIRFLNAVSVISQAAKS